MRRRCGGGEVAPTAQRSVPRTVQDGLQSGPIDCASFLSVPDFITVLKDQIVPASLSTKSAAP